MFLSIATSSYYQPEKLVPWCHGLTWDRTVDSVGGQCRDPASASRFGFVCFSCCCFTESLQAVRGSFPAAAAAQRTAVKLTLRPGRGGKWAALGRSWLKRPKSVCFPTGPSLCEYFFHLLSLATLRQCYNIHTKTKTWQLNYNHITKSI